MTCILCVMTKYENMFLLHCMTCIRHYEMTVDVNIKT